MSHVLLCQCYYFTFDPTGKIFKIFFRFQILDLRDTALGDSEVGCFSSTKTLTHLYLECPHTLRNEESPEAVQQRQQRQRQALQLPIYQDDILAQVFANYKHC